MELTPVSRIAYNSHETLHNSERNIESCSIKVVTKYLRIFLIHKTLKTQVNKTYTVSLLNQIIRKFRRCKNV